MPEHIRKSADQTNAEGETMIVAGYTYIYEIPKAERPLFLAGQAIVARLLIAATAIGGVFLTPRVILQ